jgi:P27 family predicted phage terminase small subunit
MGRKKDSDEIKSLRGTKRRDRNNNGMIAGIPMVSNRTYSAMSGYDELSRRAKMLYLSNCNMLANHDRLFKEDLKALILYSQTWDEFWKMDKLVEDKGVLLTTAQGNIIANPAVKMRRDARRDIIDIGAKFGFTPFDRQKLKAPDNNKDNPLTIFLNEVDNQ